MELTNRENWRSINLYLNYEISDIGRVKNVKTGRILKPSINTGGYYYVNLCNGGKVKHKIHRLVAEAFITNFEDKPVVDHHDGNKTNNHISNLGWATIKENTLRGYGNQDKKIKVKELRQQGMTINKSIPECKKFLTQLMDLLETVCILFF